MPRRELKRPEGQRPPIACASSHPKTQPFSLERLIPIGYGRTVAEVYANGQNVDLQLVQEGYAVVYNQFLSSCAETGSALQAAEAQARQQRLNFWSQPNPVMPWDFRRSN
ncbi:MAG: thermonuclease family protein [Nodosilinea sp.]